MAVWPFGKRSRRADSLPDGPLPLTRNKVPFGQNGGSPTTSPRKLSRRNSKRRRSPTGRKRSMESPNLQVNVLRPIAPLSPFGSRTFERQGSVEDITALPNSRELQTSPHLRPKADDNADIPYDFRLYSPTSHSSTPQPTLEPQRNTSQKARHKNSRGSSRQGHATGIPRKLSKRRKDPNLAVREEEIRAMSAPTMAPRRTSPPNSGPLVRESRQFRDGLTRNLERPISNISIPQPDSGRSSATPRADGRAYRISVLDIMAPRPIIRVSEPYAISALGSGAWSGPARTSSRKKTPVPHSTTEIGRRSKRVDSLADELDSTELRAAMERDKKRREQKKEKEADRLKRRLERRAERERAREERREEAEASPSGKPKNQKETVGLGIAPESPSAPSRAPPPPPQTDEATSERRSSLQKSPDLGPRLDGREGSTGFTPVPAPTVEIPRFPLLGSEDGDVETPLTSPTLAGFHPTFFPASPKEGASGRSKLHNQSEPQFTPNPSDYQPRYHQSESTPTVTALPPIPEGKPRRSSFLFSFFRRGDKRKSRSMSDSHVPDQAPGASFSNTSRGPLKGRFGSPSPPRLQTQASVPPTPGSRSGTPMRNRSVFKEHLPELKPNQKTPPSPPASRLNSPFPHNSNSPDTIRGAMITPTSHHGIGEPSNTDQDQAYMEGHSSKSPYRLSNPLSQSLASVDSEGSWLTGKPVKRGLSNRSALRSPGPDSAAQQASQSHPSYSEADDEPGLDDEYSRRKAPEEDGKRPRNSGLEAAASVRGRKASGNADDEPIDPAHGVVRGHGQVARQAELKRGIRVKSSEGLLRDAIAAAEGELASLEMDYDDPVNPEMEHSKLHRATSVKTSKLAGENARLVDVGKKGFVQDANADDNKSATRIAKEVQV